METVLLFVGVSLLGILGPAACAVLAHYAEREN
jgi:hypothetical protein